MRTCWEPQLGGSDGGGVAEGEGETVAGEGEDRQRKGGAASEAGQHEASAVDDDTDHYRDTTAKPAGECTHKRHGDALGENLDRREYNKV